jgi:undecaprenyl diphosphate synthase
MSVYKKSEIDNLVDVNNKLFHAAFIMDGNATWARNNNKSMMDGYLAGMKNVSNIILASNDVWNLKYVTFYVFSSENWGRPQSWVAEFMKLAVSFLKKDEILRSVLAINPMIRVIGDKSKLEREIVEILTDFEYRTKDNHNGMTICFAVSYGGRDEIVRAARKMSELGVEFNEENMSEYLDTSGIPDPQIIIRTGGNHRLSNFLLWQSHYSELYFSNTLWPDFTSEELRLIIEQFSKLRRNYGK